MWKVHLFDFLHKLSIFLESVNKSLQRIVYLFEKCREQKHGTFRPRRCWFGRNRFHFWKTRENYCHWLEQYGEDTPCRRACKKHIDKFYRIVICGNRNRLLDFPETSHKTSLHKSVSDPIFNPFTELNSYEVKKNKNKQFLLILDDLMELIYQSSIVSKIFSAGRHFQISCIILCQSFFPSGSGKNIYPQIKNNSSIFIFTKVRSKNQIATISRHL